ncbi:MAG TPA: cytochrome P450 [Ktedonobacteraceae bacterium]|nr:cytochrome P450 [Ktedonobacteraceae bacterium]
MSQSAELNLNSSAATGLNLTSSTFKANPYPIFAQLRAADPIHRYVSSNDGQQTWLVTRYIEAEAILRDERFVKSRQHVFPSNNQTPVPEIEGSADDLFGLGLLALDPPDHTRLRSLISQSFTPRMVEQWRPRIQAITDALLDAVVDKGSMDLIKEFAFPIPMRVISEILGLRMEDSARLHAWIKTIADALDDPAAFQEALPQLQATYVFLCDLLEEKRQNLTDDLVCKLILAEDAGDRLSQRELVSIVFVLILTGYETTANLIGNGVLALLTNPDQLALLKANPDPALFKSAVEECLRYHSPVAVTTFRWATTDMELGGRQIRQGDGVVISLNSANRDEQEFAGAETLDITRRENAHLAFGKGIHYCLGAPLARLEGQIAIATLLRRLPGLHLEVDPSTLSWRPGSTVNGLDSLPVAF